MDAFIDWIRATITATSMLVTAALFYRVFSIWGKYSAGQKFVFVSLVMYNVHAGWNNVLRIVDDAAFSWQFVPLFIANICLLIYLTEPRSRWEPRMGQDPRNP